MKTLALVALLCLPAFAVGAGAPAKTPETFGVPWDKALHFGVGYIAADLMDDLGRKTAAPHWKRVLVSLGLGLLLASGKEALDSVTPGNKWDWQDWAATVAGSGVAITFNF